MTERIRPTNVACRSYLRPCPWVTCRSCTTIGKCVDEEVATRPDGMSQQEASELLGVSRSMVDLVERKAMRTIRLRLARMEWKR